MRKYVEIHFMVCFECEEKPFIYRIKFSIKKEKDSVSFKCHYRLYHEIKNIEKIIPQKEKTTSLVP